MACTAANKRNALRAVVIAVTVMFVVCAADSRIRAQNSSNGTKAPPDQTPVPQSSEPGPAKDPISSETTEPTNAKQPAAPQDETVTKKAAPDAEPKVKPKIEPVQPDKDAPQTRTPNGSVGGAVLTPPGPRPDLGALGRSNRDIRRSNRSINRNIREMRNSIQRIRKLRRRF